MSTVVDTYKAVVISSFCKFLAIPVYIWAGDWGSLLPEVLQVVTRFQVFKGNLFTSQYAMDDVILYQTTLC